VAATKAASEGKRSYKSAHRRRGYEWSTTHTSLSAPLGERLDLSVYCLHVGERNMKAKGSSATCSSTSFVSRREAASVVGEVVFFSLVAEIKETIPSRALLFISFFHFCLSDFTSPRLMP
jgi:hypothetical protein